MYYSTSCTRPRAAVAQSGEIGKKEKSMRFEYIYFDNATGQGCI